MASYIKRCSVYLFPGVAAAAGIFAFTKNLNDESNTVYAAQPARYNNQFGDGYYQYKWDPNWDRRNPPDLLDERGIKEDDKNYAIELEKCKPRAVRNLIFIRHGQYNLKGKTDEERILTELGRKQAEYTGQRLKELDLPFNALHRSTMARAQETADIILDTMKENPITEIADCNLLEEGAPVPPDPPVKHWKPEVHQYYRDGARIEAAFRKYFHRADASQAEDTYEIVVCHANVIRYCICRALQIPSDAWLRFSINHCSITWFSITPSGRVVVRCIGEAGHIPAQSLSSS